MHDQKEEPILPIKDLKIKFAGVLAWDGFMDLLVMKLRECKSEEELVDLISKVLGSMFGSADEIDVVRKKIGIKILSEYERRQIDGDSK